MRRFLTDHATPLVGKSSALCPVVLMVGLTLFGADRAEVQYGYAGWYGVCVDGSAGMGMTLEDHALLKE
jgi:hypothetical protein